MRPDFRPRFSLGPNLPASVMLMIALVIAFALQQIDLAYLHFPIADYFALSTAGLRRGYVWQLLTYQFLHAGLWHLFCNLIGVWFFGRFVEERLGKAHFLKLYLLSGVAGGLLQSALGWLFPYQFGMSTVGASAGVLGLIAAFAMLEPEGEILVFFVVPLRAKYLLIISGAVALFFTVVPSDPGMAHAAHLGGILFGAAYIRWGLDFARTWAEWNPLRRKARRRQMIKAATIIPARLRRLPKAEEDPDLASDEFISRQVDPILDKISAHGIHSLTENERRILQAARAKMSGR